MNDEPYELGLARPARRAITESLAHDVAAQWRVLYRIDESKRVVVLQDIQHRSSAYRRR